MPSPLTSTSRSKRSLGDVRNAVKDNSIISTRADVSLSVAKSRKLVSNVNRRIVTTSSTLPGSRGRGALSRLGHGSLGFEEDCLPTASPLRRSPRLECNVASNGVRNETPKSHLDQENEGEKFEAQPEFCPTSMLASPLRRMYSSNNSSNALNGPEMFPRWTSRKLPAFPNPHIRLPSESVLELYTDIKTSIDSLDRLGSRDDVGRDLGSVIPKGISGVNAKTLSGIESSSNAWNENIFCEVGERPLVKAGAPVPGIGCILSAACAAASVASVSSASSGNISSHEGLSSPKCRAPVVSLDSSSLRQFGFLEATSEARSPFSRKRNETGTPTRFRPYYEPSLQECGDSNGGLGIEGFKMAKRDINLQHCRESRVMSPFSTSKRQGVYLLESDENKIMGESPPRFKSMVLFGKRMASSGKDDKTGTRMNIVENDLGDSKENALPMQRGPNITELQQQFLQSLEGKEHFVAKGLKESADLDAIRAPISPYLEKLLRLYRILRILMDRLHDRRQPLLVKQSIYPAYLKVVESVSQTSPNKNTTMNMKNNNMLQHSSTVPNQTCEEFLKSLGKLIWLAPDLLGWKIRNVCETKGLPRRLEGAVSIARSPLQKIQADWDVELLDFTKPNQRLPTSYRASDSKALISRMRNSMLQYTFEWYMFICRIRVDAARINGVSGDMSCELGRKLLENAQKKERWMDNQDGVPAPEPLSVSVPNPPSPRLIAVDASPSGGSSPRLDTSVVGSICGSPLRCVKSPLSLNNFSRHGVHSYTSVSAESQSPLMMRGRDRTEKTLGLCRTGREADEGSPLSTSRRTYISSPSPSRSPISERLRRRAEERMAERMAKEAERRNRADLHKKVRNLLEAQEVLLFVLDACIYKDKRQRIDIRVLVDLYISHSSLALNLDAVHRALEFLQKLSPNDFVLEGTVLKINPKLNPQSLREQLKDLISTAKSAAAEADLNTAQT